MGLVHISGSPGAGARYYATRIVVAETDFGRRTGWLAECGAGPQAPGVIVIRRVEDVPAGLDLLVVDDDVVSLDESVVSTLARDVIIVTTPRPHAQPSEGAVEG